MTKWNPSLQLPDPCSRPCPCPRSSAAGKVLAASEQTILAPKRSNVGFWTRFAANDTVHFLAACFVETASFALQSAHFRNNAHVFRAKAHVRKTSEANGVVCRNDVQSTRLEPLGMSFYMHLYFHSSTFSIFQYLSMKRNSVSLNSLEFTKSQFPSVPLPCHKGMSHASDIRVTSE
jgi:hypothetical protein